MVGLWNHVLIMIQNPLCPTLLAPKRCFRVGLVFFYEIATAADGFGFGNDERIGKIMTKVFDCCVHPYDHQHKHSYDNQSDRLIMGVIIYVLMGCCVVVHKVHRHSHRYIV